MRDVWVITLLVLGSNFKQVLVGNNDGQGSEAFGQRVTVRLSLLPSWWSVELSAHAFILERNEWFRNADRLA